MTEIPGFEPSAELLRPDFEEKILPLVSGKIVVLDPGDERQIEDLALITSELWHRRDTEPAYFKQRLAELIEDLDLYFTAHKADEKMQTRSLASLRELLKSYDVPPSLIPPKKKSEPVEEVD